MTLHYPNKLFNPIMESNETIHYIYCLFSWYSVHIMLLIGDQKTKTALTDSSNFT